MLVSEQVSMPRWHQHCSDTTVAPIDIHHWCCSEDVLFSTSERVHNTIEIWQ